MSSPSLPPAPGRALNRYLSEEAAIIIMILDQEGVVLEANRFARTMAGQDIVGRNLSTAIVDFTQIFDLQTLVGLDRTHLLNVSSGQDLPQTFYFRFFKENQKILAIAELHHQEVETLRRTMVGLNNDLSNLNRELQKKNAELVKLNDLKNQFLGIAAHDLRNPLGAIHTLSEFLLDEAGERLSQEHLQFIEVIHSSSRFMLTLLDQLLDIARIEAGRLDLDIQPADMIALVKSCVDLNQVIASKKRIRIRFDHYEFIPIVEMDSMKIEQVLHNLISNAVKYSPPDTLVTVSVFLSGENITVSVADQGPGIPPQDIQNLFKPFSRTSVKAPGGEKSTGLGLAIVHKIVLGHLGKIWVESKVGLGSTFYFSLPLNNPKRSS